MIVEAALYKPGMENGFDQDGEPYMIISHSGYIEKAPVHRTDYIVKHKGYTFLFRQKYFLKLYTRIYENEAKNI